MNTRKEMIRDIVEISPIEDEYPVLLREISSPPKQLFIRGNGGCLSARHPIAVVGTRGISEYGKQVLYEIIPPLVKAGMTIVSGLAYGVDALAHEVALKHGGCCIAVLASGVDQIYPRGNAQLANRILGQGGALISEQALGTQPRKQFFPARNRIISGLSKATIVVEAGERSGALITAQFALDQNREVYAVPGSMFWETSHGTNKLIASGAFPIFSSTALLEQLGMDISIHAPKQLQLDFSNELEKELYNLLRDPHSLDELTEKASIPLSTLSQTLSMMELNGVVRNVGNMRYVRV